MAGCLNQQWKCYKPTTRTFSCKLKLACERIPDLVGHFRLLRDIVLGSGSFGTVVLALDQDTNAEVAVKIIEKRKLSPLARSLVRGERKIFERLMMMQRVDETDPDASDRFFPGMYNLAKVMATYEDDFRYYFVMDVVEGVDLISIIEMFPNGLTEDSARQVMTGIVDGLRYLHSCGIAHLDIKLENVLYDEMHAHSTIVDFGFSHHCVDDFTGEETKLSLDCGTLTYLAPEVIQRKHYSGFKADVYSLGVLFFAILCGQFPFSNDNHATQMLVKKLNKKYHNPSWQMDQSPQCADLLSRMLEPDPQRRISLVEVSRHPWMQKTKPVSSKTSIPTSPCSREMQQYLDIHARPRAYSCA